MRERELGINVRVNQSEKRKLEANARKRSLTLSAYLRKAGLEKEMQAPPTAEFQAVYHEVYDLQQRLPNLDKEMIAVVLEDIQSKLLNLYCGIDKGA